MANPNLNITQPKTEPVSTTIGNKYPFG